MNALIGAYTQGCMLALFALGIYITFRIFNFPDITGEGSYVFGGAITAVLIVAGYNPILATLAGFTAGMASGFCTGLLHVKFGINSLISGILVMTALYSINLDTMGKSNVSMGDNATLLTYAERAVMGDPAVTPRTRENDFVDVLGWRPKKNDLIHLAAIFALVAALTAVTYWFFRTNMGTAMRATGDNDQMIRALGVNTGNMIIFGTALSNGFIGLSGSLFVQHSGFADVQMGMGMVVSGLASVIVGEALVGSRSLGLTLVGAIMGSVLYKLVVSLVLSMGMPPNDLKLVSAVFVFTALVLPGFITKWRRGRTASAPTPGAAPARA
ncbi:ABC transporter permease [Verrucomicrobia bacterium LW23]|nr:ABC transporter permease [Verrucomicrobia bacterium LW23]